MVIDQEKCIGCGICTVYCPADPIHLEKVQPKGRRAYIDQEHGTYGFSALSFAFFLLAISEDEVLIFLKDFKSQIRNLEENNEVA